MLPHGTTRVSDQIAKLNCIETNPVACTMMSVKPPTMLPFRKNTGQGHDILGRDSILMSLVVQVHVVQAARLNDVDL